MLVREIEETSTAEPSPKRRSVEAVLARATERGVAGALQLFLDAAIELELPVKPWSRAVTITAVRRRNPTLLYLRPDRGALHVWVSDRGLREYAGLNDADLAEIGPGGQLTESDAKEWVERFVKVVRSRRSAEPADALGLEQPSAGGNGTSEAVRTDSAGPTSFM